MRRWRASLTARVSAVALSVGAQSSNVRAGEVTRMPSWTVRSQRASAAARCTVMPSGLGWPCVTEVSNGISQRFHMPHSTSAERCESTACGPHASTAAAARSSGTTGGRPTAYTPRWTRCRRPVPTRCLIAWSLRPTLLSCARVTLPCCRLARAAISSSGPCRVMGAMRRFLDTLLKSGQKHEFTPVDAQAGSSTD